MKKLLLILFCLFVSFEVKSKTVFTCGSSEGYIHFFDKNKFETDKIKDGMFTLRKNSDGWDFGFVDYYKEFTSVKDKDGEISVVNADNQILVSIIYGTGVWEKYQLNKKTGLMVWTSHRFNGTMFDNVKMMKSKCKYSGD